MSRKNGPVAAGVAVGVGVGVRVGVAVGVGAGVGVDVGAAVGLTELVGVALGVGVGTGVAARDGVEVAAGESTGLEVAVGVAVGSGPPQPTKTQTDHSSIPEPTERNSLPATRCSLASRIASFLEVVNQTVYMNDSSRATFRSVLVQYLGDS